MIDMSKKYQTRDGRAVRLLCVDGPHKKYPVYGFVGPDLFTWTIEGAEWDDPGSRHDLIEVAPDFVRWRRIFSDDSSDVSYKSLSGLRNDLPEMPLHIAIQRTTICNGGKSHADVTVDVLPCDYQEPTP